VNLKSPHHAWFPLKNPLRIWHTLISRSVVFFATVVSRTARRRQTLQPSGTHFLYMISKPVRQAAA
jgi:hypothetical protein